MNYKFLELKDIVDEKGKLVVIQNGDNKIPFDINRIFYMFEMGDDVIRGKHSNVNSEFIFICLSGSCRIKLDDTFETREFLLDSPKKALYLGKLIWKEMFDFSKDAVLLVLSNCIYDSNEYIYDYEHLKKIMRNREKNND